MLNYEEILAAARKLGLEDEIREMAARGEALAAREGVNVAVVGGVGSGKTTLVNLAAGRTLRKPSLLPDPSPSMRVCFERAEDDPRFECVSTVNRLWGECGATLYELNAVDGRDPALLDEMDMAFFTTPVTAAMTASDLALLEELRGIKTVVVLTGADRVRDEGGEDEVERIRAYVEDVLRQTPAAGLLVSDPVNPAITVAQMLAAVPVGDELAARRRTHAGAIWLRARERVVETARRALEDNASQALAAEARLEQAREEALTRHAEWGTVRSEFLADGAALALKLADELRETAKPLASRLNAEGAATGYSRAWLKKQLPARMEELLREALIERRDLLAETARADLERALERARELGLNPGVVFEKADIDTMIRAIRPPERANRLGRFVTSASGLKVAAVAVAGAGALVAALTIPAVSGAMLSVMPTNLWAFMYASAAAPYIRFEKVSWDVTQWQAALTKYARDNCNQAATSLTTGVVEYYKALYRVLTNVMFPEPTDEGEALERRRAELEGILAALEPTEA